MKFLFLLAASAALVGCGKVALNGNRLGQDIKLDPVTIAPTSDIISICQAIALKTAAIAGPSANYQFGFAQKPCYDPGPTSTQPGFTTEPAFSAVIETRSPGGEYYFKRTNGGAFFDVETTTTGAVSAICNSLGNLKDQIQTHDNQVITFSTSVLTTDCSAGFGQKCLQLTYHSPVAGSSDTYRPHTFEFLKFNVNTQAPNPGFWVERKKVSRASCGGILQQEQVATFISRN